MRLLYMLFCGGIGVVIASFLFVRSTTDYDGMMVGMINFGIAVAGLLAGAFVGSRAFSAKHKQGAKDDLGSVLEQNMEELISTFQFPFEGTLKREVEGCAFLVGERVVVYGFPWRDDVRGVMADCKGAEVRHDIPLDCIEVPAGAENFAAMQSYNVSHFTATSWAE